MVPERIICLEERPVPGMPPARLVRVKAALWAERNGTGLESSKNQSAGMMRGWFLFFLLPPKEKETHTHRTKSSTHAPESCTGPRSPPTRIT